MDNRQPTLLGGIIEYCTGCRACEQICPHGAITMQVDKEGFLESVTDFTKCVDCGLCRQACPQNIKPKLLPPSVVYAARDKDDSELKVSASGGAFAAAARVIISNGGVAVGAAYNDNMTISHVVIDRIDDLPKLQSSKYVQSNTENTFRDVKKLLREGKTVLYSGTPCQIAGLKGFLRKDYANLYTMDLICHGVPSPKLFAKYLQWMGKKMNGDVIYYDFRDKSTGWGLEYMTKTKTKTKTSPSGLDPYYYHFLSGDTYRECCYRCQYCRKRRVSDITIGDYWGIEKQHPFFYSPKGVSCLLINTEKGQELWDMISNEFVTLESTFDNVAKDNHNLVHPTPRPAIRDKVYQHLDDMSVEEYFSTQLPLPFNLKARVKRILPAWFKIIVKKYKWQIKKQLL